MIITTDNVSDLHIPVIDCHAEVISRRAIRTGNDQVIQFAIGDGDLSFDDIKPADFAIQRIFEADDRLTVSRYRWQGFARFRAPGAVIARLVASSTLTFTHGFDFFR